MEWVINYILMKRVVLKPKLRLTKKNKKNCKIINDREHFQAALLENTSEVFKPISKNDSLKEKKLVKQLKD